MSLTINHQTNDISNSTGTITINGAGLTVDNAGKVGIGTSPSYPLHVQGNRLYLTNAGNTELMTTNTNGNVTGGIQALSNQSLRLGTITNYNCEMVVNNAVKGTWSANGLNVNGELDVVGPVTIDTDNNAGGALRIEANQTNPEQDFYFAQEILSTLSGSQTVTGTREQGGLFIDVNSSATGGTTTEEHRAYGIYVDLDVTGDADNVWGVYSNATVTPTTGTVSNVYGGHFTAEDNGGAGNVSTVNGVYGLATSDNSTSDASNMYGGNFNCSVSTDSGAVGVISGLYSEVTINTGAGDVTSTTHGVRTIIDNNTTQQTNSSYLFKGEYQGTLPTTPYGVYITNDVPNYFGGSVGIGTASPSAKLELNNGGAGSLVTFTDGVNTNFNFSTTSLLGTFGTDAGSTALALKTSGTERMRLTSAGNVGIGITAPSQKLVVAGNVEIRNDDVDGYIWFHDPNTRSWSVGSDRSTGRFAISSSQGVVSNLEFQVDASGNVIATGNVTAYSDERLKSDITTIDNALDKVQSMRGVTFTKDGEIGSGVIAQELEKIAPELVMDGEEYKSVAYGNLVGYLIEAVKELSEKVEALENGSSN